MKAPPLPRVLCTNCVPDDHLSPLHGVAEVLMGPADGELMGRSEVLAIAPTLSGIINQAELHADAELAEAAPHLRVVANVALGADNLDLAELSRRKIWATNVPDAFVEPTADCALGLILSVTRRIVEADRFVRSGAWGKFQPGRWDGLSLNGKTLGLLGFGRIGRGIAKRAAAFGMEVLHFTRHPTGEPGYRSIDTLLEKADVVCLCLPLNADSRRLFTAKLFGLMKRGSIFINVARGKIVDESALVDALQSGHLAGAGLDVFENEPAVHPALIEMSQVVLTAHLGGATRESRREARMHAAANVAAVLKGQRPLSPLNQVDVPRSSLGMEGY